MANQDSGSVSDNRSASYLLQTPQPHPRRARPSHRPLSQLSGAELLAEAVRLERIVSMTGEELCRSRCYPLPE